MVTEALGRRRNGVDGDDGCSFRNGSDDGAQPDRGDRCAECLRLAAGAAQPPRPCGLSDLCALGRCVDPRGRHGVPPDCGRSALARSGDAVWWRRLPSRLRPSQRARGHSGFGRSRGGEGEDAGLARTLATCLAFTFLNPHVYLDTVVLLGTISTRFPGQEASFAAGAMTASCLFFFALGFGARRLRPVFANPVAWRVLDGVIAVVMVLIAVKLLVGS